jgi:hypothetical protein
MPHPATVETVIHQPLSGPVIRASESGPSVRRKLRAGTAALTFTFIATACASAGPGARPSTSTGGADVATDAEWRALASPRPASLPDVARISFAGVELPDAAPWSLASPVPAGLGLSELVVTGLLRRADVEFVERRRFAAAVDAERAGGSRPPGAPPAGLSRGAELTAAAAWLPLGAGQAVLEVRLMRLETGAIVGARRLAIPADADPVGAARAIVATILATLDEVGRLPSWGDPLEGAAPATYRPTGIPQSAVEDFLEGLGAEERWNWELARRSYQSASGSVAFFEARVALARTARLRLGGTLGES